MHWCNLWGGRSYGKIKSIFNSNICYYYNLQYFWRLIYFGSTIYDDFPDKGITFNEYTPRTIIIRNNAPFTFPFVNPGFMTRVNIINQSGNISCQVETGKGNIDCNRTSIDLGVISAGNEKNVKIFLSSSDNSNFSIQIDAYLNLLHNVQVQSKIIRCMNSVNKEYICS